MSSPSSEKHPRAPKTRSLTLLCFGLLGALTGSSGLDGSAGLLVVCFVAAWLFGWLSLLLVGIPLRLFFYGVVTKGGSHAIGDCLNRGFLPLLPFTVLALMADLLLGWNATSAFASAGIMFSGGATASALAKADPEHPPGFLRSLIPALAAAAISFCWLVGAALLLGVLKAAGWT